MLVDTANFSTNIDIMISGLHNVDHPANYITAVACSFLGSIGFLGNIFMVWFLCHDLISRKPYEYIILGMCLSDGLFCLSNVFEAYFILHFESMGCKINGFFDYIFGSSSLILPCLAMLNR